MTDAAKETSVSVRVTVDLFNFFHDVGSQYFLDHPIAIGGPGTVVEIDESKFGERAVDGHWIFKGIERRTTNSFMVVIEDRSAAP